MSVERVLGVIGHQLKQNKKYLLMPAIITPLLLGFVVFQIVDKLSASEAPAYDGVHDDANCERILGCAWDRNRPSDTVKIEILDNDSLIATVTADQFRQDLFDSRLGNGKHAFTFVVTPELKDGRLHVISLRVAGTQIYLQNTPKKIYCNSSEQ
jgi:hypothetical protein